jgi:hypothetical protein
VQMDRDRRGQGRGRGILLKGNGAIGASIPERVPDRTTCPICLVVNCERWAVVSPCGHLSCWECITQWHATQLEDEVE